MSRWESDLTLPTRWLRSLDMSEGDDMIRRLLGPWSPRVSAMCPEIPALVKPSMRFEESRRRSFLVWSGMAPHMSPTELARAGFYYIGPGDRVQCFCCGVVLRSWEPGDNPHLEHRKFYPRCPFLQGEEVGNIPQPGARDCVDGQILGQLQRLPGGQEQEEAAYPEMMAETDRLTTYRDWPPYAEVTPEQLARAGFFYTGHRDNVKCFHCDGGLRNWERGDNPWQEHAKWFPRCEFLAQTMGQAYIRTIQDAHFSSPDSTPEYQNSADSSPASLIGSPDNWQCSLQSSVAQGALEMGFEQSLVLSLLQSRFLLTGTPYNSVSDLVTDLVQAEEERATHRSESVTIPDTPAQRSSSEAPRHKDPEPPLSTEEQLRRLKEERMCKVCMDKDVSMVFVPCGHLVVCTDCAPNLRHCPICRAVIRGSVRAFMS
ncbi:baculoviral IAP repeat-containing protein 7 [Pelodytes ibericus]